MAAGIGSRFRGAKQVEGLGPGGETLLDYAVADAARAGFGRVVLVTRRDLELPLRERAAPWQRAGLRVDLAFQELDDVPAGWAPPRGRTRPWGTGHAVLAARGAVDGPFAVINADDFYGRSAFAALAAHLAKPPVDGAWALAAFPLAQTLSPEGPVARGLCDERGGRLVRIEEVLGLSADGHGGATAPDGRRFVDDTPTSMNAWGFTPRLFGLLGERFAAFLAGPGGRDPAAEFQLPTEIGALLAHGQASVEVLRTGGVWFGLTHPGDRERARARLRELHAAGEYRTPLFA
jgi:hypothetical protein